jgi:hypothetical protein
MATDFSLMYNPNMLKTIPSTSAPFFQEYSFSKLDADEHAALVIERLMAYGNREEVRWLFAYYGRPRLLEWLLKDGRRMLPDRRYQLWCVLLSAASESRKLTTAWNH